MEILVAVFGIPLAGLIYGMVRGAFDPIYPDHEEIIEG